MIDNSPSGSFKKALAAQDKRNAANADLVARNDRIKRHIALGCEPAVIAAKEGVSLEYVRRVGVLGE